LLGYFVISKVTRAGKVIHIRIKHFPGGTFCVEGTDQEYATLQQLVQTSQYLHLEMDKVKNDVFVVCICFYNQNRLPTTPSSGLFSRAHRRKTNKWWDTRILTSRT
jgi:hypothetical protein